MTKQTLLLNAYTEEQRVPAQARFALIRPFLEEGVPQRSIAAIHRQVVQIAEEQGWPHPSYGLYDHQSAGSSSAGVGPVEALLPTETNSI